MPEKVNKKQPARGSDQRRIRSQQVVFIVISVFIILAMLLSFIKIL